jgi:probable HAF family extracellular repeat protein
MKRLSLSLLVVLVVLWLGQAAVAYAAPSYIATQLPDPPGATFPSIPAAINNAVYLNAANSDFKIVGRAFPPSGPQQVVYWARTAGGAWGTPVDLGTLGGLVKHALGINDGGYVVGDCQLPDNTVHAFIWDKIGGMKDLGVLASANGSSAYGINIHGQIAGNSEFVTPAFSYHACVWESPGQPPTDLGGPYSSGAYGINDSGQIVGYAQVPPSNVTHAFLWEKVNGIWTGTDLTPISTGAQAYAINNHGEVVGTDGGKAFIWDKFKQLRYLQTPPGYTASYADSINNKSQVVGHLVYSSGNAACIWYASNNNLYSLSQVVIGKFSGYVFDNAYGINDQGWITADWTGNIAVAAYVFQPVTGGSLPATIEGLLLGE